ncbi:MAG: HD domain-containing protein [Proteobacteria bacterium]|nr:HD domain-containing protein [Pseudomonadota bacterium]MBU1456450.1 HD domain-containing protein [Pseudomonadota bacterium]
MSQDRVDTTRTEITKDQAGKMSLPRQKQAKILEEKISATLYLLRIIITNTRLYSIEHEKVREMVSKAFGNLSEILNITRGLTLLTIDNDLIINNRAIRPEEAEHFRLFLTILKEKEISHITFKKGITPKELVQFLSDLSSPLTKTVYNGPGISCGKLGLKEGPRDSIASSTPPSIIARRAKNNDNYNEKDQSLISKLQSLSQEQLTLAQELYFSVKQKKKYNLGGVQDAMSSFVTLFSQNLNPLSMLTTLKSGDEYTFTHVINVCILTLAQAESLGFKDRHLYDIGITAALHDIGKIFIPDEILTKPAKLDQEEREVIETHSMKGAGYILNLNNVPKLAVLAALEHHIRFDGSGYPNIGRNWKTHIVSQMISIADTFDAMRSSRPYHAPAPEKKIIDVLLNEKGSTFNPLLVDNFLTILARNRHLSH